MATKEKKQIAGANIKISGHKCFRCGHEWRPKKMGIPKVCPKCKSPYWDRPKNSEN